MESCKTELTEDRTKRNIFLCKNRKLLILASILAFFVALMLAVGCTQNTNNGGDEPDDPPVMNIAWSENSDCDSCHVVEVASGKNKNCPYSIHVEEDTTCMTCHVNTDRILADAHKNYATGTPATSLKKTSIPMEICLECHDKDELKAISADSTVLTDLDGTVVNQHDLPDHSSHESIGCNDCHRMHKEDDPVRAAPNLCITCHHQMVFECNTCHD